MSEPPQSLLQRTFSEDENSKLEAIFRNYVVPDNVLHIFHEVDLNVLTRQDMEKVRTTVSNSGPTAGAIELFSLLRRYNQWYQCLQKVLRHRDVKLSHAAEEMDEVLSKSSAEAKSMNESPTPLQEAIKEVSLGIPTLSDRETGGVLSCPTDSRPLLTKSDKPVTENQGAAMTESDVPKSEALVVSSFGIKKPLSPGQTQALAGAGSTSISGISGTSFIQAAPGFHQRSNRHEHYDFLLVGKTGHGKSATGNSLIQRKFFKISSSSSSVTSNVTMACGVFEGKQLSVVDGPGVSDTSCHDVEAKEKACDDMNLAVSLLPEGFHALLLVLKYGTRYTEEERKVIPLLKDMFGENIIRDYSIIIITHGEVFDMDSDTEGTDFSGWVSRQDGAFKELLEECQNRYVLFRNNRPTPQQKRDQVIRLIQVVQGLKYRETRYTSQLFDSMQKQRERLVAEAKAPELKDKIIKMMSCLMGDLQQLKDNQDDWSEHESTLENLDSTVHSLLDEIKNEDKGTGALKTLKKTVSNVQKLVEKEKGIHCQRKHMLSQVEEMKRAHEIEIAELKKQYQEKEEKLRNMQISQEEIVSRIDTLQQSAREHQHELQQSFEQRLKELTEKETKTWRDRLDGLNKMYEIQMGHLNKAYKDALAKLAEGLRGAYEAPNKKKNDGTSKDKSEKCTIL